METLLSIVATSDYVHTGSIDEHTIGYDVAGRRVEFTARLYLGGLHLELVTTVDGVQTECAGLTDVERSHWVTMRCAIQDEASRVVRQQMGAARDWAQAAIEVSGPIDDASAQHRANLAKRDGY